MFPKDQPKWADRLCSLVSMFYPTISGAHKPRSHNTEYLLRSSNTWSASTTWGTGSYESVGENKYLAFQWFMLQVSG